MPAFRKRRTYVYNESVMTMFAKHPLANQVGLQTIYFKPNLVFSFKHIFKFIVFLFYLKKKENLKDIF